MRRRWIALLATAACTGTPRPPDIAPVAAGPNVAGLGAQRIASGDPARSASFYAALLGGQAVPDGEAWSVRTAPDGPGLRIESGRAADAGPPDLEFTVLDLDAALVELSIRRIEFEVVDLAGDEAVRFTDGDGRRVTLRSH